MPTPTPVDDLVALLRGEANACLSCAQTVDAYTAEELENEASLLVKAADRLEAQAAEIARLREALVAAADDVKGWGAYADKYFQEKWDLAGDIARIREAARLSQPEEPHP